MLRPDALGPLGSPLSSSEAWQDASEEDASEGSPQASMRPCDDGHMLATTPESQQNRRSRRRMQDGGDTPNPLFELAAVNASSDFGESLASSLPEADDLTPQGDSPFKAPSDQVHEQTLPWKGLCRKEQLEHA